MDYVDFQSPPNAPFVVMEGRLAEGPPVRVLLDSGAAAPFDVIVSPKAAEAARLKPQAATGSAHGVGGAASVSTVELPSFSLGPVKLANGRAAVLPALEQISQKVGAPVDVLVGASFLKGRVVSIDYGARRVNFDAPAPASRPEPAEFAPKRPLMLVRAKVNGEGPFVFALDTGASHTLVSTSVSRKAGVEASDAGTVVGAGGAMTAHTGEARVAFGPHARDVRLVVSDAVAQIGQAAGSPLDGVLGADVFGSGVLTLDYATGRVWMEPSTATP